MIIVALGANLDSEIGSPVETLDAAVSELEKRGCNIVSKSRTYLTAPVPVSDDPWYHNSAVAIETYRDPYELLSLLQSIEDDFGRVRSYKNAPRLLDLDLICYDDQIVDKPELIVPHPRMHERAFVLHPVSDVCAGFIHPVTGVCLSDLMAALPDDQEIKVL